MADIIRTSIGSRSDLSVTVNGVSGTSPGPYTVTLSASVPATAAIGDRLHDASGDDYLIEGISGSDLTVHKRHLGATSDPVTGAGFIARCYATPVLWDFYTNLDLVSLNQVLWGECWNDGPFISSSQLVSISGATTSQDCYRVLKCGPGQSFRDHVNKLTNALRWNPSNGVSLEFTGGFDYAVQLSENYSRIEGLQIKGTGSSSGGVLVSTAATGVGYRIDWCIIEGQRQQGTVQVDWQSGVIANSLILTRYGNATTILEMGFTANISIVNCSIVVPAGETPAQSAVSCGGANAKTIRNCAMFGVSAVNAGGTVTFENCKTNVSSGLPDGCTTATYANQFVNDGTVDESRDYRLKAGADCIDAGTADFANGTPDIVGTTRPVGTWFDVGAWEFGVAESPSAVIARRSMRNWSRPW